MSITNPTSDNLAQTAHALAGYGIALTAARFGTVPLLVVAGLFIAYAAIKEFWFDMHYETPGSIRRMGAAPGEAGWRRCGDRAKSLQDASMWVKGSSWRASVHGGAAYPRGHLLS